MLREKLRRLWNAVFLPEEKLSELALARRRLERARSLFNEAAGGAFDYANAELTAALKYLEHITSEGRVPEDQRKGELEAWRSA